MNRELSPKPVPAQVTLSVAFTRFIVQSVVAGLLGAMTLVSGAFLFWLVQIGSIANLHGWVWGVGLTSLMIATTVLLIAVRFYSVERPSYGFAFLVIALACFVIAMSCLIPIVLLVLRDTGVLTLDRFW